MLTSNSPTFRSSLCALAIGFAFWALPAADAESAVLDPAGRARVAGDAKLLTSRAAKRAPRSRVVLPARFRRAVPRAAKLAAAASEKALAQPFKPTRKKKSRKGRTAALPSMTVAGPSAVSNGVKLTSSATVSLTPDGMVQLEIDINMRKANQQANLKSKVGDNGGELAVVPCPTADGVIELESTRRNSMTTVINDGSRIKGSVTEKLTRTIRARARVGRDARFSGFDAELTVKAERYERGLQTVSTIVRKASASRSGAISLSPAHVKTTVKLAGAPRGVEGAIERAVSSDFKRSDPFEDAQSTFAERLRQHILEAEPKWYDVPNQCATLTLDPPAVQKLPEGSTMLVRGTVKSAQGTESGGDFATTAIARGQFNAQKPASEPGSPAVFEAKAAEPDASDVTVSADLLATSPAGRATASWSAISPPPAVDITYSGTMDYARNEGNASTDSQHLVKADYQWSVSWKDVDLDSGLAAMAASSSFDGDWSDTGRHGAAGPGNFLCGGPLVSLNPEFAMVTATATSASHYRLKAMPFLSVHPDYEDIGCSGLPSPPFEHYHVVGNSPTINGDVTFDFSKLADGPLTIEIEPDLTPLTCEEIPTHIDPCMQTPLREATLTISLAD